MSFCNPEVEGAVVEVAEAEVAEAEEEVAVVVAAAVTNIWQKFSVSFL
jgi:Na+-transporting methylmalonyl-CoA/oxaloacetate decarboxylase gamma subunit